MGVEQSQLTPDPSIELQDIQIKASLIGDYNSGKKTIVERFVTGNFVTHFSSIGIGYPKKTYIFQNYRIELQLFTDDSSRYQRPSNFLFQNVDCCILVYDITNKQSFDNLKNWYSYVEDFNKHDKQNKLSTILIGNKCDLESKRVISLLESQQWCIEHDNIPFFESSAKENINITEAFQMLTYLSLKNKIGFDFEFGKISENIPDSIKINSTLSSTDLLKKIKEFDDQLQENQQKETELLKQLDELHKKSLDLTKKRCKLHQLLEKSIQK